MQRSLDESLTPHATAPDAATTKALLADDPRGPFWPVSSRASARTSSATSTLRSSRLRLSSNPRQPPPPTPYRSPRHRGRHESHCWTARRCADGGRGGLAPHRLLARRHSTQCRGRQDRSRPARRRASITRARDPHQGPSTTPIGGWESSPAAPLLSTPAGQPWTARSPSNGLLVDRTQREPACRAVLPRRGSIRASATLCRLGVPGARGHSAAAAELCRRQGVPVFPG